MTSAPGITSESRNRGIQIDGASGADNRFMIDGVDTTNLLNGTSGKALAARLRRHRAGEGERLRGRVPRVARRRHQRHHQVGRQSVSRQRRHLLHRRQPAGRRPPDAAAQPVETEPRRVRHDPGRRLFEPGADLRPRRADLQGAASGSTSATTRAGPIARRTVLFSNTRPVGTFSQKPSTQHPELQRHRSDHA